MTTTDTLPAGTIVILIGAAVAIIAVLTLILTRKLGTFLLLLAGVGAVVVFALAMLGQAEATGETAVAAQQASVAAQEAAQAATTATVGQTVSTLALAALAGMFAIAAVAAAVAVVYFWLRAKRAESRTSGNWKPGPNALWGRNAQPQISSADVLLPMLVQQVMAMQQAMMQQQGTSPYPPTPPQNFATPALPPGQYVVDDGDAETRADWDREDWQI